MSPRPGEPGEWREVEVKIRWEDHKHKFLDAGLKPPLRAHTRPGYYYEAAALPSIAP